ncbi:hypothetical protein SSP35_02_02690 [Streptomyces sp. NBRC 110611]|nr:hypothetical protein SSP35_02_02690 [Streptomyces sp. NBRC 110611]
MGSRLPDPGGDRQPPIPAMGDKGCIPLMACTLATEGPGRELVRAAAGGQRWEEAEDHTVARENAAEVLRAYGSWGARRRRWASESAWSAPSGTVRAGLPLAPEADPAGRRMI